MNAPNARKVGSRNRRRPVSRSNGLAFGTRGVMTGNGLTTPRAKLRLAAKGRQGLAERVGLGHVTEAVKGTGNPGGKARAHGPARVRRSTRLQIQVASSVSSACRASPFRY